MSRGSVLPGIAESSRGSVRGARHGRASTASAGGVPAGRSRKAHWAGLGSPIGAGRSPRPDDIASHAWLARTEQAHFAPRLRSPPPTEQAHWADFRAPRRDSRSREGFPGQTSEHLGGIPDPDLRSARRVPSRVGLRPTTQRLRRTLKFHGRLDRVVLACLHEGPRRTRRRLPARCLRWPRHDSSMALLDEQRRG